jgi:hypothetical protein
MNKRGRLPGYTVIETAAEVLFVSIMFLSGMTIALQWAVVLLGIPQAPPEVGVYVVFAAAFALSRLLRTHIEIRGLRSDIRIIANSMLKREQ